MTENLCVKIGCKACCCRNMSFENIELEEAKKFQPNLILVDKIPEDIENGAYFFENTLYIEGACTHLQNDFSCGIYNSPNRPEHCANFQIESKACKATRKIAEIMNN